MLVDPMPQVLDLGVGLRVLQSVSDTFSSEAVLHASVRAYSCEIAISQHWQSAIFDLFVFVLRLLLLLSLQILIILFVGVFFLKFQKQALNCLT